MDFILSYFLQHGSKDYNRDVGKILVVDDHADSRETLRKLFEAEGHTVECVANGKEALASVIERSPDLVVLDLAMPVLSGINFLDIIRSYLRLVHLPVIVLTGVPDTSTVESARLFNVDAIFAKGRATFDEILGSAEQALQRISRH